VLSGSGRSKVKGTQAQGIELGFWPHERHDHRRLESEHRSQEHSEMITAGEKTPSHCIMCWPTATRVRTLCSPPTPAYDLRVYDHKSTSTSGWARMADHEWAVTGHNHKWMVASGRSQVGITNARSQVDEDEWARTCGRGKWIKTSWMWQEEWKLEMEASKWKRSAEEGEGRRRWEWRRGRCTFTCLKKKRRKRRGLPNEPERTFI
jgi:hypothetical protein